MAGAAQPRQVQLAALEPIAQAEVDGDVALVHVQGQVALAALAVVDQVAVLGHQRAAGVLVQELSAQGLGQLLAQERTQAPRGEALEARSVLVHGVGFGP